SLVAVPEVESQEKELSQESEEEGGEVHSRSERERARRRRAMGITAAGAPMIPAKRMAKMRQAPKDSMRFTAAAPLVRCPGNRICCTNRPCRAAALRNRGKCRPPLAGASLRSEGRRASKRGSTGSHKLNASRTGFCTACNGGQMLRARGALAAAQRPRPLGLASRLQPLRRAGLTIRQGVRRSWRDWCQG